MLDRLLIEDLAFSPPQVWKRRIDQAAVIEPLARSTNLGAELVKEACGKLGISRRQFYQLLGLHRARLNGSPPRSYNTGVHYHIDEEKERIIAEAISAAGPAAREAHVYAHALRLSQEQGVAPPSQTSVRTRFGKRRTKVDLINRLQLACDYVADLCPLDLIVAEDGPPATAWLLTLIDSRTRTIFWHHLHAGRPAPAETVRALAKIEVADVDFSRARLGHTSTLRPETIDLELRASVELAPASHSRKIEGGAALKAVCGRSLGRVRILTEASSGSINECTTKPVPLALGRGVIACLVSQVNGDLRRHLART